MIKVFSTFHPAYLLRDPSRGLAVESHLAMLDAALDGREVTTDLPPFLVHVAPDYPPHYPVSVGGSYLFLDIETYGILEGQQQTCFHPLKSVVHDHKKAAGLVATVSLAWKDAEGAYHAAMFVADDPIHRRMLKHWLERTKHLTLLGQNLTFDLLYLRHSYPELRHALDTPQHLLLDLMITNYLHDEGKPERSLENLAPLLNVTRYEGGFRQYPNAHDPDLWKYNCKDTIATLLCQEKLEAEIVALYGNDTKKLSPFCRRWYSDLLWLVIWMSETGISIDTPKLESLQQRIIRRLDRMRAFTEARWEMPLSGKGSEKARRSLISEALAELPDQTQIALAVTEKTKKPKFDISNRNALLNVLPKRSEAAKKLRLLGLYQDYSKLLTTYLDPMLVGRGKGQVDQRSRIIGGRVYPLWFPVPSQWEDGSVGGTKQSRFSAKQPGVQTFPPKIKRHFLADIWVDYSQIELRVAALLSNDPVMSQAYRDGIDLHDQTTILIFGPEIVHNTAFKSLYRQVGKQTNFLVIYRGGPDKLQVILLKKAKLSVDLSVCQKAIQEIWKHRQGLRKWQQKTLDTVKTTGYYELPLIGQSRLFLGGRDAVEAQLNEIVNMPVQVVASNITQSAQFECWRRAKDAGLKSTFPMNWFDALCVEEAPGESEAVNAILQDVLPNPPYYQALCGELGRTLPLEFEIKRKDSQ